MLTGGCCCVYFGAWNVALDAASHRTNKVTWSCSERVRDESKSVMGSAKRKYSGCFLSVSGIVSALRTAAEWRNNPRPFTQSSAPPSRPFLPPRPSLPLPASPWPPAAARLTVRSGSVRRVSAARCQPSRGSTRKSFNYEKLAAAHHPPLTLSPPSPRLSPPLFPPPSFFLRSLVTLCESRRIKKKEIYFGNKILAQVEEKLNVGHVIKATEDITKCGATVTSSWGRKSQSERNAPVIVTFRKSKNHFWIQI